MTIIAAFKSKKQMILFDVLLRKKNVKTKVVPTPKAIALGCGLSVEITQKDIEIAKQIIADSDFTAFEGFYKITRNRDGVRVIRIFS